MKKDSKRTGIAWCWGMEMLQFLIRKMYLGKNILNVRTMF